MGIRRIDEQLCIGCGACVDHCSMDVLRMNDRTNKPMIMYLRDCMSCFMCERDCPVSAIYVLPVRERRIPLPW
ncbi:MAG: ferredoxin family protein [Desulfobacteraceae bacterium]|nr:MAG: ferredoxin family protein [Desulfobacteraceae bacterium]